MADDDKMELKKFYLDKINYFSELIDEAFEESKDFQAQMQNCTDLITACEILKKYYTDGYNRNFPEKEIKEE